MAMCGILDIDKMLYFVLRQCVLFWVTTTRLILNYENVLYFVVYFLHAFIISKCIATADGK
jgi:hypothetical protein